MLTSIQQAIRQHVIKFLKKKKFYFTEKVEDGIVGDPEPITKKSWQSAWRTTLSLRKKATSGIHIMINPEDVDICMYEAVRTIRKGKWRRGFERTFDLADPKFFDQLESQIEELKTEPIYW